jgi:HD-GYP domain-containing protein (c-di-GMP phosphodiesterase class II)
VTHRSEISEQEMAQLGRELMRQLFVLLRIARTYGPNNEAWDPGLDKVKEVVERGEGASLRVSDNVLYMEDVRLKSDREAYAAQKGVTEAFAAFGIGALELGVGYDDEVLKQVLTVWGSGAPSAPEEGYDLLAGLVEDDPHIQLGRAEVKPDAPVRDRRTMAKAVYARTLDAVTDVMESVKIKQTLPLKRAKRVMHRLVDNLLAEPTNLMGLTTLRCYDEYTYHHSVNVCVLSLAVGRRLGIPKPMMEQLGMASLFHDMGKSQVPIEILNKPSEFTEEEWAVIRRHPVYGVKTLVRLKGADELAARVVTGSFEHHMNYDNSGYPALPRPRSLSLYGRIISLCDCYDAMTSSRVYNRTANTPERALKFMLNMSGKAFDPVLIKVFVNTVGIVPVGTLLLLDTGEVAVAVRTQDDPTLGDRPVVRIIADKDGHEVDPPVDLSLDEKTAGGSYARNIARILDPAQYHIDVSRYFL